MKTQYGCLLFLTLAALFCSSSVLWAAGPPTNNSAPAKTDIKLSGRPFRGTIKTVDQKEQKVILKGVKAQTFVLVKDTRIFKDDQPAKFSDLEVGDPVTGYAQKTPEGTWQARTLYANQKSSIDLHNPVFHSFIDTSINIR
jgi:hypothetical protein